MIRFLLELRWPEKWGKNPKTDRPQTGGVIVIGDVTKKPENGSTASIKARQWKSWSKRFGRQEPSEAEPPPCAALSPPLSEPSPYLTAGAARDRADHRRRHQLPAAAQFVGHPLQGINSRSRQPENPA